MFGIYNVESHAWVTKVTDEIYMHREAYNAMRFTTMSHAHHEATLLNERENVAGIYIAKGV